MLIVRLLVKFQLWGNICLSLLELGKHHEALEMIPELLHFVTVLGLFFDKAHSESQQTPACSIIFEGFSLILIRFEIKQVKEFLNSR